MRTINRTLTLATASVFYLLVLRHDAFASVSLKNEALFKKSVQTSAKKETAGDCVETYPGVTYSTDGARLEIYNKAEFEKGGLKNIYDRIAGFTTPAPKNMQLMGYCDAGLDIVATLGDVAFKGTDHARAFASVEGNGGCEVGNPFLTVVATKADDLLVLHVEKPGFLAQPAQSFQDQAGVMKNCGKLQESYKAYKTDDWCLCFYKSYLSDPAKKAEALKEIGAWMAKFELK